MTILDEIVADKKKEIIADKRQYSVKSLESSKWFDKVTVSMKGFVVDPNKTGVIAEFKRRSPSKGLINGEAIVTDTVTGYAEAGVSGISVLTDEKYFGGTKADLIEARDVVRNPILRKDFVVDEFQILQAKSIGADTILLIAAILTPSEIKALASFAHSLNLEVLLEVHDLDELERSVNEHVDLLGVNNRDLKVFKTDIQVSKDLAAHIPNDFVKVSESGISDPNKIADLKTYGYEGFLIGENFMKTENPGQSAIEFGHQLRSIGVK